MNTKTTQRTFGIKDTTSMKPMPQFNKIVINRTSKYDYILIPITHKQIENIRLDFLTDEYFTIKIGKYVIGSTNIILFGEPFENSSTVKRKLESIISSATSLTTPTPIDEDKLMVGSGLNTAATIYMAFRYYVCLIGKPKYVLIFKYDKTNKNK